jgi:hypothetical protein
MSLSGTKPTSRHVCFVAALGVYADIEEVALSKLCL